MAYTLQNLAHPDVRSHPFQTCILLVNAHASIYTMYQLHEPHIKPYLSRSHCKEVNILQYCGNHCC